MRYLLAVDASQNSLKEIVKAISVSLGTGRISLVSKEDAFLDKDISVGMLVECVGYTLHDLACLSHIYCSKTITITFWST